MLYEKKNWCGEGGIKFYVLERFVYKIIGGMVFDEERQVKKVIGTILLFTIFMETTHPQIYASELELKPKHITKAVLINSKFLILGRQKDKRYV